MARMSVQAGLAGMGALVLAGAAWIFLRPPAAPAAPAMPAPVVASATAALTNPVTPPPGKKSDTLKPAGKNPGKGDAKPVDKTWNQLTVPQQAALMPLAGEWNKLEALRKQKWLEVANRFVHMDADEQERVHDRMREWVQLTPEQRRMVRENFARSKKIEPGLKSEQWELYQQLPEEQKQKLAADAAKKKQLSLPPSMAQKDSKPLAPIKSSVIMPPPMTRPGASAGPGPGLNPAPTLGNGAAPAVTPAPPARTTQMAPAEYSLPPTNVN